MRQYRLLLVDDSRNVLKALSRVLTRAGLEVRTASDAESAIHELDSERYDMIVSDETMPGMSGTELMRLCRKRFPHMIRMLMTGLDDEQDVDESARNGDIEHCFSKPWDDTELVTVVNRALSLLPDEDTVRG